MPEHLQNAFTRVLEDKSVLDHPAPLIHFLRDSGAEYKCTYQYLLMYLDIYVLNVN